MEVALFGAAGYSGLELAKLLAGHPHARLACAASDTHAGKPVAALTGRAHGGLAFVTTDEARALAAGCGIALLAVPPEPALALTRSLRAAGVKVIDLSHAHRATGDAVYGLASLFPDDIARATVVANPGCYATAVIMACAPLVRDGLVTGDLTVVAGSGVTGAGRQAVEELSLGEMYGEVRAYKVLRHQHVPEIEAVLARLGSRAAVVLTTHLLPVARGIFATITARLAAPCPTAALTERFRASYADDPTVIVAASAEEVSLRKVVGTNTCMVGVATDDRGVVVVTCALDNLLKGAAGQAVENLNLMLGFPRLAGLDHLARHV
ncbi:MAG: N-acetyl-gamma-glutamyl-phosphate reductase [Myxococcota bacterium]|nr:N-acetyl-gamma-glutamyl-phosphate reductase [Myxococcota bacterium]